MSNKFDKNLFLAKLYGKGIEIPLCKKIKKNPICAKLSRGLFHPKNSISLQLKLSFRNVGQYPQRQSIPYKAYHGDICTILVLIKGIKTTFVTMFSTRKKRK